MGDQRNLGKSCRTVWGPSYVNKAPSLMRGWAKRWARASTGTCRNALGKTCWGEVRPSPQCGITPAFQLTCMLSCERHNLRTGCTYRTAHVDVRKDLLNMQADMQPLDKAPHFMEKVHPHCHAALPSRYVCHLAMYNQSLLYTPARSKPFCRITYARRAITSSHGTRPAMHGAIQVSRGAMPKVREVLPRMLPCVQTS